VPPARRYDLVADTYCLQSGVRDEDGARLFAAVHAWLEPGRRYLISTAMHDPARRYVDGEDIYEETTGGVLLDGGWGHWRNDTAAGVRAFVTAYRQEGAVFEPAIRKLRAGPILSAPTAGAPP
jgi:hypothetical protein